MRLLRYAPSAPVRLLLFLFLAFAPCLRQAAAQSWITVNSTDDVVAAGDGACTLREAIRNANDDTDTTGGDCATGSADDTIEVPAGTYVLALTGDGDDGGDLDVRGTLTIVGAGQAVTILDADGIDRVLEVHADATVVLDDLTLTGGLTEDDGGAVLNDGTLTLNRCAVRDSESGTNGGGLFNAPGRTLTVNHTTVDGNAAVGGGGGIYNATNPATDAQTRVVVWGSTLSHNTAGIRGGGFNALTAGNVDIRNSTISGNAAPQGGGIWIMNGAHNVGATTFVLANSTVADNQATAGAGGGIFGNDLGLVATTAVRNSIIAGNTGPGGVADDCAITTGSSWVAPFTSEGFNLLGVDESACGFDDPTDVTHADVQLDDLADNGGPTETHLPRAGSPAIDAGNPLSCEAEDQRGEARPIDADQDGTAACDIGAVELRPDELGFYVDAALSLAVSLVAPGTGNTTTFTLTLGNEGSAGATGLAVTALLPAGLAYVSHDAAAGTAYDPGTGLWEAGDLGAHESVTLTITATYTGPGSVVFTAGVTALDQTDAGTANDEAQATVLPDAYGPGAALSFDGSNDYVGFAVPPADLPAGGEAYTLEAWFRADMMGARGLLGWGQYGTGGQVIALRLTPTGILHYWWDNDLTVTTGSLTGAWHHVAVTYDGTTRALYLDGVLEGSDTPGAHSVPDGRNFRIGSTGGGEYFDGQIDEVRVWNVARTQAQLQADMNRTLRGDEAGLVGYWRFDAGSGGIAHGYSLYGDAGALQGPAWSTSGAALGQSGALVDQGHDPNTVGPAGGSLAADLTSTPDESNNLGLYFYGALDGDIVAGEGFSDDLSERLNPVWGVFARGTNTADVVLDYSGVDGITTPAAVNLLRRTDASAPWSVVTGEWVHDAGARTFTKTGVTTFSEFALAVFAEGDLAVEASVDDPAPARGETVVFTITLHNDAADPATGVEVSVPLPAGLAYASDTPSQGTYDAGTGLWSVGAVAGGGDATLLLAATAHGAGTVTAAISASDVVDLDTGDDTAQAVVLIPAADAGSSLAFDGSGGYVRLDDVAPFEFTMDFTVEAWIRPLFDADWQAIVAKGDVGWRLHRSGSTNQIAFSTNHGFDVHDLTGTTDVADGAWHHVAAVYDDGVKRLYVDGRLEATFTLVASSVSTSGAAVDIGYNAAFPERRYNGAIDEVRLWNVARSAGDLLRAMHRPLDGDEAGLVGYWRFDEGGGSTVYDNSVGGTTGTVTGSLAFAPSSVPLGPGTTADALVSADGTAAFAGTGLDLTFTGVTGAAYFAVTRLDQPPGGTAPAAADGETIYDVTPAYWVVDHVVQTDPFAGTIDFTFVLGPDLPGGDPADLKLLRRSGNSDGDWSIVATATTVDPGTGTVVFEDVPCCSQYLVGSTDAAALPVELSSFTATLDGEAVVLRWETASETNNAGFEVEYAAVETRRGASLPWQRLAFVDGAGTTTTAQTYAYRAEGLSPGRYAFRLRQVDFDGAFVYGPEVEVTVEMPAAYVLEPAFPNPFGAAGATIRFGVREARPVTVTLYDVLGRSLRLLYQGTPAAGQMQALRVEGGDLPSGTYFVRLSGAGVEATRRLLLVK